MTDRQGHIVELQSLRGIASLIVVVSHCLLYSAAAPSWVVVGRVVGNGHSAVVLFFVLSGFVLSRSLRREFSPATVATFYLRRVFRIYPALIAATAVGIVYLHFLHDAVAVEGVSDWFDRTYNPHRRGLLWFGLSLLGLPYVLPPVWSILVELLGSVMLPIFAWSQQRRPIVFVGLMATFTVIGFMQIRLPNVSPYFVDIAMGCVVAAPPTFVRRMCTGLSVASASIIAIAVTVVLIAMRSFWLTDGSAPAPSLVEGLLASVLIGLIVYSAIDLRPLRSPVLKKLGDISYSLYLFHWPVMAISAKLIGSALAPARHPGSFTLALLIATLAITIPLAWASYRLIERGGIAVGVRLLKLPQRYLGCAATRT